MDDDAISRIEAALEAGPTPGPWRHEAWGSRILDSGVGSSQLLITTVAVNTFRDQGRHNAEFIAACNPVAIRTLLDRLKAAEAENERLRDALGAVVAYRTGGLIERLCREALEDTDDK